MSQMGKRAQIFLARQTQAMPRLPCKKPINDSLLISLENSQVEIVKVYVWHFVDVQCVCK